MVGFYNSQCTCIYVSQGSSDIKLEIKFELMLSNLVHRPARFATVLHHPAQNTIQSRYLSTGIGTPYIFTSCVRRVFVALRT